MKLNNMLTIQEVTIIKDALEKVRHDIEQSLERAEEVINRIIIKE